MQGTYQLCGSGFSDAVFDRCAGPHLQQRGTIDRRSRWSYQLPRVELMVQRSGMGSDTAVQPTIQTTAATLGTQDAAQMRCSVSGQEAPPDLSPKRDASDGSPSQHSAISVSAGHGPVLWACQDLNLGPHPYQQNAGNRCANHRSRRSRSTADGKVMWSHGVQLCALILRVLNETLRARYQRHRGGIAGRSGHDAAYRQQRQRTIAAGCSISGLNLMSTAGRPEHRRR